jgi:2-polyprenyl-3-methyl-5-hydroxy-6-metoxy-1,4-benzoquinol methylase
MTDESQTSEADAASADEPSHRYERAVDPESDTTHGRVVQLVGRDRRVLELGPANGHVTAVLQERGCTVVGIEVDAAMAAEAEPYAERMIVGDLDVLDLEAELGGDRFDVIVAADVLEHLKNPLSALRRLRPFLAPGGFFVASLPNIAHGSVRLALLEGNFRYSEVGLLDRTHLRFFTREIIADLFDEAELGIAELYRQPLDIAASEVTFDAAVVPAEIRDALEADVEARTYQFVIKAVPLAVEGMRELQRHLREAADDVAELRAELVAAEREHERLRADNAQRLAENEQLLRVGEHATSLREALIEAHDQVLRRDEEISRLHDEMRRALGSAAAAEAQNVRLRVRLERINSSAPMRAYQTLAQIPGIRSLKATRTAGYNQAVRDAGADG